MDKYEYIKWFWKHFDDEEPVILFYEVDLENERYATRMTEIFINKSAIIRTEDGCEFVTEAPIPTIDEINLDSEFYAEIISKEEFEIAYNSDKYIGDVSFPI